MLPNWTPHVAKIFGSLAFLEDRKRCGQGCPCKWASYRDHYLAPAMLRAEAQLERILSSFLTVSGAFLLLVHQLSSDCAGKVQSLFGW